MVNWGIGFEFLVDPFGDQILELRGVVSSGTVGPLPKLDSNLTQKKY
jgi:hypothetical protein